MLVLCCYEFAPGGQLVPEVPDLPAETLDTSVLPCRYWVTMVSERSYREQPLEVAMAGPQKVIITCALTGSGHTPSMSPYLPYTVEDVVGQGVAAAEAGAAVLHLHARDPKDGSTSADPKIFAAYASGIRQRSDVVISISTGGGTGMSVQERLAG